MELDINQIKALITREFPSASTDVAAFVARLEGLENQIKDAKTLLEANGYVVTAKG